MTLAAKAAARALDLWWDRSLPVDVPALAAAAGVPVLCLGLLAGGVAEYRGEPTPAIVICDSLSDLRRPFVLAHTLAYRFLATGSRQVVDAKCFAPQPKDPVHAQANAFARALLMPASAVRLAIHRWGLVTLDEMVQVFGVSPLAMAIRLEELGVVRRMEKVGA